MVHLAFPSNRLLCFAILLTELYHEFTKTAEEKQNITYILKPKCTKNQKPCIKNIEKWIAMNGKKKVLGHRSCEANEQNQESKSRI